MTKRHLLPLCILAATTLVLTGCSGSNSNSKDVSGWQKSVEQYVHERGDDPAVLRDVTLEDNRPGFAVIGGLEPAKSTDARAVLLGHKTIDNRPWFIYLVGIVNNQKVQEIRIAALSMSNGQTTWHVGPRDSHALKLYQNWGWNEWKKRSDGHSHPPAEYADLPAADMFELTLDGARLTAKHTASGATWTDEITAVTAKGGKTGH